jgi:hypothetical protein
VIEQTQAAMRSLRRQHSRKLLART